MTLNDILSAVVAALNTEQYLKAEKLCQEALRVHPQDERVLVFLAASLQQQHRLFDALAVLAELISLFPESSVHWGNYGAIAAALGRKESAEKAFQVAIHADPSNPVPRVRQGLLLLERNEYIAARRVLLDAVALNPTSAWACIHAARACCLSQDLDGAGQLLKLWRSWMPLSNDHLQMELAQVLVLHGDVPGAAEVLNDLLSRQPHRLDAQLLLASVYERFNKLSHARDLAEFIAANVNASAEQHNEAHHLLATLALRDRNPAEAKRILDNCGPQGEDDYAHYFQLAAANDKLGDAEAAMEALSLAHQMEVRERRFDSPECFSADAPALANYAPRVSSEQFVRWPSLVAPDAEHSPVFVVGFPRSGTTLLEQMLDAHPSLQSMDENPFFNSLADFLDNNDPRILKDLSMLQQYDCDELRKRYYVMVAERVTLPDGVRLVDKNPLNMQWLPLIYRLFPKAKFILALRHPCDVLLSCYMQSFRASTLAAACSSLERLAHAYVETMRRWLADVELFCPEVMESRYESLVHDFHGQANLIAGFLGLDDAGSMLAFDRHARNKSYIGTPSYSQVIEPVNHKAVGRWHKYRKYFEPVLPILDPMLQRWGYSATHSECI